MRTPLGKDASSVGGEGDGCPYFLEELGGFEDLERLVVKLSHWREEEIVLR